MAAETACGKRDKMFIYGDDYPTPDGTCIRDFIHVEDLAKAHLRALEYLESGGKSEILNCGYGRGISVKQLIAALKEEVGKDFLVEVVDRRPGDLSQLISRADKIKQLLDWTPKNEDLKKIVRSAYQFELMLSSNPPNP